MAVHIMMVVTPTRSHVAVAAFTGLRAELAVLRLFFRLAAFIRPQPLDGASSIGD
jgi:hypothetical protein